MPTFDFFNVIRKICATAISAVCSPVSAVLAASALLAVSIESLLSLFADDFEIPTVNFSLNIPTDSQSWLSVLLYAIDFPTLSSIISWVVNFTYTCIVFGVKFVVSLLVVLISIGVFRVTRRQLKDLLG